MFLQACFKKRSNKRDLRAERAGIFSLGKTIVPGTEACFKERANNKPRGPATAGPGELGKPKCWERSISGSTIYSLHYKK
jgi:hypothetical protein